MNEDLGLRCQRLFFDWVVQAFYYRSHAELIEKTENAKRLNELIKTTKTKISKTYGSLTLIEGAKHDRPVLVQVFNKIAQLTNQ